MGFFSKIKRIFKGKPEAEPEVRETAEAAPEEIEPEVSQPEPSAPVEEKITRPKARPKAEPWKDDLLRAFSHAEPKLSIWLEHILQGIDEDCDELWDRLLFLFTTLEAPEDEAKDFIGKFRKWLDDMGYHRAEEFRSELQYRLALALDLEDEEDERSRLFVKLSEGLAKTKQQLSKRIDTLLSASTKFDEKFWEELEEILIMADVGFEASQKLLNKLRERVRKDKIEDTANFKTVLGEVLADIFHEPKKTIVARPPEVVLMIGVNGVGKTTTIAKLANRAVMQGRTPLVAAGDTFRAAAIEQLEIWANRCGAGFYAKKPGADPAAVAFEAVEKAEKEGYDLVFVDTAGRLHTKVDLMEELKKVKRVLDKKHPGAPHKSILVLDATTGQNALSQVKLFNEAVAIDEIILTKLDGTAKGGVVVAIALDFDLPISFVGLGEKMEDLRPFSGKDFAQALLDI